MFVAELTVPAGKVASTLTDFVVRVDLADMPTDWWADTASDLGNVRVKSAGSVIPFDIVAYDRTAKTGELFFKATLTTGANVFTVETVDSATALDPTDANGRNAVWSDYDAVLMAAPGATSFVNRNGGAAWSTSGGPVGLADGWIDHGTSGRYLWLPGLPQRSAYSIGVSTYSQDTGSANKAHVSYTVQGSTSNGNRVTLVDDGGNVRAVWNNSDSWRTFGAVPLETPERRVVTFNGSAQMLAYVDGSLALTDDTISPRPPSSPCELVVGAGNSNGGEPWYGRLARVYLRDGILSADWIAAEAVSWETPADFYTVEGEAPPPEGELAAELSLPGADLSGSYEAPDFAEFAATLIIPAGAVSSTLMDFPVRVDLADMPDDWWGGTAPDGSDIAVRQGGVDVPTDLVKIDAATRTGELFFKAPTLTTGDNVFTVERTGTTSLPAPSDPNGREDVWADYDAVVVGQLVNRADGAALSTVGQMWPYEFEYVSPTLAAHMQGATRDEDGNWFVAWADELRKYDSGWNLLATRTNANAATGLTGTDHIGDPAWYDGELFTVVEAYPNSPYNNQHVVVWNPDLTFNRSYDVSAGGHECSSLVRRPTDGHWFISDFTVNNKVHEYDENFGYVGAITLSPTYSSAQGIAWHNDQFYLMRGASNSTGGIATLNPATGAVTPQAELRFSGAIEGLHIEPDGTLYVGDSDAGRFIAMRPVTDAGVRTARFGHAKLTGLPKRTSWTMSASASLTFLNGNAAIASYSEDTSSNEARASLMLRSNRRPALWNSDDAFLEYAVNVANMSGSARYAHTQDGTTDRKLWVGGILGATDVGVVQRPGGAGDTLFVGAEDTSAAEQWFGTVDRVYLRDGVLSADWLAAEAVSWETPSAFYEVTGPEPPPTGVLGATLPRPAADFAGDYDGPLVGTVAATMPRLDAAFAGAAMSSAGTVAASLPVIVDGLEFFGDYDPPVAEPPPSIYYATTPVDLAMAYPAPILEES